MAREDAAHSLRTGQDWTNHTRTTHTGADSVAANHNKINGKEGGAQGRN